MKAGRLKTIVAASAATPVGSFKGSGSCSKLNASHTHPSKSTRPIVFNDTNSFPHQPRRAGHDGERARSAPHVLRQDQTGPTTSRADSLNSPGGLAEPRYEAEFMRALGKRRKRALCRCQGLAGGTTAAVLVVPVVKTTGCRRLSCQHRELQPRSSTKTRRVRVPLRSGCHGWHKPPALPNP